MTAQISLSAKNSPFSLTSVIRSRSDLGTYQYIIQTLQPQLSCLIVYLTSRARWMLSIFCLSSSFLASCSCRCGDFSIFFYTNAYSNAFYCSNQYEPQAWFSAQFSWHYLHGLLPMPFTIIIIRYLYYIIFLHCSTATITMDNNNKTQLCAHIGKLTRKALELLLTYNYTPVCSHCKLQLRGKGPKINLEAVHMHVCLHCGVLFCGQSQCINQHQVQSHYFYAKTKIVGEVLPSLLQSVQQETKTQQNKSQIICRECGSIENLLAQAHANSLDKNEEYNKLMRFNQFVQNTAKILNDVIVVKFNEYQQLDGETMGDVFGLRNLGNTCFFNSVLQVLYHTQQLSRVYIDFMGKSAFSYLISQEKQQRKDMEYYYDEVIEKQQANNWHVVASKKPKPKERQNRGQSLEKFVAHGLVRDNKINSIYGALVTSISILLTAQQGTDKNAVTFEPVEILSKLTEYDHKYALKQEQDAEELLIFLIDLLSQGEMLTIVGASGDRKNRYDKVENLLGRQRLTPVQQIFGSYLASRIVCLGCDKESWVTDFTYHLPVSLQQVKYQQKSIQADTSAPISGIKYYRELLYPDVSNHCKIFGSLFKAERLTNAQNYYSCETCSGLAAIKQFYMLEPPSILVISFKRFENNKKGKITTFIPFDEEINIEGVCLRVKQEQEQQPPCHKYELYAVIVHKGETISSGHYICYVKVQSQTQQKCLWYQFSDEKCKKVTTKQVLRQQAYIIFYRKLKTNQTKL